MYSEAGYLTPPRPLSAKALRDKMEVVSPSRTLNQKPKVEAIFVLCTCARARARDGSIGSRLWHLLRAHVCTHVHQGRDSHPFMSPLCPCSYGLSCSLQVGYLSSTTDIVGRATAKDRREAELAAVRARIEEAQEAVKASEDLDPVSFPGMFRGTNVPPFMDARPGQRQRGLGDFSQPALEIGPVGATKMHQLMDPLAGAEKASRGEGNEGED